MNKLLNIKSTVLLNNGVKMPLLGLGTYQLQSKDIDRIIRKAIEEGYLLLDTASVYKNEEALGSVLENIFKEGKIKREDIFITTKVGAGEHGFENVINACNQSLKRLKLDYIDLYLIHWPGVKGKDPKDTINSEIRKQTWKGLEKVYNDKKVRSIGVSNYTIDHLKELLGYADIKPSVNQVEFHPFFNQKDLFNYCIENNIILEAYSSLTRGEKLNEDTIANIANSLGKTRAQIMLRWAIQKGVVVIPKTSNEERIIENSNIFDFEISSSDMEKLDSIEQQKKVCWDPSIVL